MSPYFDEDAEISMISRKLRGFSDHDLAWLEFISPMNVAIICGRLKTTPHILMLAQQYETARRKAYPQVNSVIPCHRGAQCSWPACKADCDGRPGTPIGGNDVADGRDLVLGNRPVAPSHPEIGAHLFSSEAVGPGSFAPQDCQPAAVKYKLAGT